VPVVDAGSGDLDIRPDGQSVVLTSVFKVFVNKFREIEGDDF